MARTYHIDIDSYIGYPISKAYVKSKLSPMKGKPCAVRISSYGGDVQTALDIRQQFIDHGQVTAYIVGMTASAATILAMGAHKVVMSRYALMLVHPCSGYCETWGYYNSEELEKKIAELRRQQTDIDTLDRVIASIYAAKAGAEPKDMAALMAQERWITADEALKLGLIDEIDPDEAQPDPAREPMTAAQREHFVACGLPLPTFAGNTPEPIGTEARTDTPEPNLRKTIGEALRDFFNSFFTRSATASATATDTNTNNSTPQPMKQNTITPATLCAMLGVDHLTATDGHVTLSAEQITALDTAIKALQDDKLKAEQALDAADGDTTAPVKATATDEGSAIPGSEAVDFYHKYGNLI